MVIVERLCVYMVGVDGERSYCMIIVYLTAIQREYTVEISIHRRISMSLRLPLTIHQCSRTIHLSTPIAVRVSYTHIHTKRITLKTDFTVTQIMSAVAIAQRKLKIAQALERQAATELISAAKLDAFRKVKAAATLEGGKRRRRKAASTGTKKKATKKKSRKGGKRRAKK